MFEPQTILQEVKQPKIELYHDNLQNYKRYNIPPAQLVIADIPYNLGKNAYASSTEWYIVEDDKLGANARDQAIRSLRVCLIAKRFSKKPCEIPLVAERWPIEVILLLPT